jgi:predicted N-acetyltransferase YhbS
MAGQDRFMTDPQAQPDVVTQPDVVVRPMVPADISAAWEMTRKSLDGVSIALDATPHPGPPVTPETIARGEQRFQRVLNHDPAGAWVAESAAGVVGVALGVRRGPLWMLSLLAVAGEAQGQGIGRRLLDGALRTSAGSSGGLIIVSRDPRAMRRYHQAGFALEPAYAAEGSLDRSVLPGGLDVRDGDLEADAELLREVAISQRGSHHGGDIEWLVSHGSQLFVLAEGQRRGFAVAKSGVTQIVAATDPEVASRLLWSSLATSPVTTDGTLGVAEVDMLTARQQWAIDVAMAARLPFRLDGSVAMRGEVRPFTPYLPSGIWG